MRSPRCSALLVATSIVRRRHIVRASHGLLVLDVSLLSREPWYGRVRCLGTAGTCGAIPLRALHSSVQATEVQRARACVYCNTHRERFWTVVEGEIDEATVVTILCVLKSPQNINLLPPIQLQMVMTSLSLPE